MNKLEMLANKIAGAELAKTNPEKLCFSVNGGHPDLYLGLKVVSEHHWYIVVEDLLEEKKIEFRCQTAKYITQFLAEGDYLDYAEEAVRALVSEMIMIYEWGVSNAQLVGGVEKKVDEIIEEMISDETISEE